MFKLTHKQLLSCEQTERMDMSNNITAVVSVPDSRKLIASLEDTGGICIKIFLNSNIFFSKGLDAFAEVDLPNLGNVISHSPYSGGKVV